MLVQASRAAGKDDCGRCSYHVSDSAESAKSSPKIPPVITSAGVSMISVSGLFRCLLVVMTPYTAEAQR